MGKGDAVEEEVGVTVGVGVSLGAGVGVVKDSLVI